MSNSCLMPVSVYVSFPRPRVQTGCMGEPWCAAVSTPDGVARSLPGHALFTPDLSPGRPHALLPWRRVKRRTRELYLLSAAGHALGRF